ncbi:MAG TPA: PBP1A family penicillin-binding protein [Clostridia bacterium]|nr:PBP1A family penicillin-binding protein [Clostridia bacterium]
MREIIGKGLCAIRRGMFGIKRMAEKLKAIFGRVKKAIRGLIKLPKHTHEHDAELFMERKRPRPFALAVLFNTMKFLLVALILLGCAGLGLAMGVAKAYVETSPELDVSQLTQSDRTSYIYDKDGNLITTFARMQYREWATIDEIPDMLKNAVIAIEDVRFYKHKGVDYKRLLSAVINLLRNKNSHGASTLTQQLVKNKILSSEQTYKRKIQEAYLSLEVETIMNKDAILEAYLNDVYLGGSNYGMKTAAMDYFGKALNELSIRECAMLAGMVQKPYYTDPRANTYKRFNDDGTNRMNITNDRTDLVIEAMYEAGSITKEQRNYALNDTVNILESSTQTELYDMPYFVEYAIRDVITHMLEQRGLLDTKSNRDLLEKELGTGGYSIYLTVDTKIQHSVQDTLANWTDYPDLQDPSKAVIEEVLANGNVLETVEPQATAVVIDFTTGELRAVIGGRTSPTMKKQFNRAYQSRTPVGSSIKPIAVYGPALDLGLSPASVILNFPAPITGWNTERGYPYIGSDKYIGPITLRRGLVSSLNVAAARTLLDHVGTDVSTQYLLNLGVDPSQINPDGSGLALGTSGITPIEMAAAFAAIANKGEYIEPLSFTRVVDANGKVILDANDVRKTRQVFKKSTAYMLVDLMSDAVKRGTGTTARIDGMNVAGKTGTNSDYSSVYFAGMTPYYAATVWIGHDNFAYKLKKGSGGKDYAAPLWQAFMEEIHEGLANKPIIDESPAELGLVKSKVCTVSGLLATDACALDDEHPPVTDWFQKGTEPTENCDMHVLLNVCAQTMKQASYACPTVLQKSMVLISSTSMYAQIDRAIIEKYMGNVIFTDIPASEYGITGYEPSAVCTLHGGVYVDPTQPTLDDLLHKANVLLSQVQGYLAVVQNLPDTDRNTLAAYLYDLNNAMATGIYETIQQSYDYLSYNYAVISSAYPPPITG